MTSRLPSRPWGIAIIAPEICRAHDVGDHPDHPGRLGAIRQAVEESGLQSRLLSLSSVPASPEQVAAVHDWRYIHRVQTTAEAGGGWLDADTGIGPHSYAAALAAAGAVMAGVDVVLDGQVRVAFALVRPPGHHARPSRGMGFCLFNNIAIAATYARAHGGLERIAIVDIDAHHGNGTQEVFYTDPGVLYISTHQFPFYPGTGSWDEIGSGPGRGLTINIPLPAYSGDPAALAAYQDIVVPALQRFRPQLILVSAGYDAHWADPLTHLSWSIAGYAAVTRLLREVARDVCAGRMVWTLEGGYDLNALGAGVVATLRVLLGDDTVDDPLGPFHGIPVSATDIIRLVKRLHAL